MIIDLKKLSLWGYEVVIRAKASGSFTIMERLQNEACFYYVLDGHSNIHTPDGIRDIPRLEGFALQCGQYVANFIGDLPQKNIEVVVVKFPREVIRKIYDVDFQALLAKQHQSAVAYRNVRYTPMLKQYIDGLLFYIENPQLAIEELLVLKIKELFLLLAQTDNFEAIEQLIQSLFQEYESSFTSIIEEYVYTNVKLAELAHLCAMSLSTFKRRFRREFGQTPRQYFTSKRMDRARHLIEHAELPLAEVAEQSGYSDYANFSAAFKRYFGDNPSTLRPS